MKLLQHGHGCVHANVVIASFDKDRTEAPASCAQIEHAAVRWRASGVPDGFANGLGHSRGQRAVAVKR